MNCPLQSSFTRVGAKLKHDGRGRESGLRPGVGLKGATAFAEYVAKEEKAPIFALPWRPFLSLDSPLKSKWFADVRLEVIKTRDPDALGRLELLVIAELANPINTRRVVTFSRQVIPH